MEKVKACAVLGAKDAARIDIPLDPLGHPEEVGLLCTEDDETDEHLTYVGDATYVRMVAEAARLGLEDLELPADGFPIVMAGWPDEWEREALAGGNGNGGFP